MTKSILFVTIILLAGLLCITGCSAFDKKAPTTSNFKAAIQATLDQRPQCLIVLVPKDIPARGKLLRPDAELEPYRDVGLVSRTEEQVDARPDWMMFYGPKSNQKVPGYHYDLTDMGRQLSHPATHQFMSGAHVDFCYAVPEVDEVVRLTQPADAWGMTVTQVTYRYHLANFVEWAKNPAFVKAKHLEGDLALASQPKEESMELILTSDGWRNHP